MAGLRTATGRPQYLAYFIAIPLALVTIAVLVPLTVQPPATPSEIPTFLLFLGLFTLFQATLLPLEVRRHSFVSC